MEAAVRWSSTGDRRRFLVVDVSDSSLTLNEVDHVGHSDIRYRPVTRCTKLPSFGAFAWSPVQESLVALGLVSGNASLIRLGEEKQSSEVIATFKVKQQRKCNSVALNSQDWLAVALDKTRSDVCLSIYDTNGDLSSSAEPIRRLCAAELVSSVRFFSSSSHELVATTQRSFIRIYGLRDGYFGTGGSGNLQASTRHVNNITIDPLDEHYFASVGSTGDPSFTVWDKRWMTSFASAGSNSGAVLNVSLAAETTHPTTIRSLRWSGVRRGRLGLCTSGGEIRVIDVKEVPSSASRGLEYLPVNPYGGALWQTNRYVAQSRNIRSSRHGNDDDGDGNAHLIAFDWIDGPAEDRGLQKMVVLRPNREVNVIGVPGTNIEAQFTARDDFVVASNGQSTIAATGHNRSSVQHAGTVERVDYSVTPDPDAEDAATVHDLQAPETPQLSSSSIAARDRCRQGYLFDCRKNAETVAGDWQLERLWEIIRRLRTQSTNDSMVYGSLDLSYIGVAGLWAEQTGNESRRSRPGARVRIADAIVGLAVSRDLPAFVGERTNFPEHRQLCLAICGWQFTTETLEAECQQLIERGLHYQAIVQAVLHDYKHIALNLLRTLIRSRTVPNIGLGALLASDSMNEEQREMCRWMAADTDDPALKALLAFLTTGDWRDVMKTTYLHLGYRVALGLKYLNDTELSGFLQTETARAVRNGDLEGILLTGLGEQAMNLFQTYIARIGDLQTAVLATAYTNPRYVDDVRWEMWKETYFEQMQSWRAFNERTKFTVQHARLAKSAASSSSSSMAEPTEKARVLLRCNHCHSPLQGRRRPAQTASTDGHTTSATTKITGPAAHAGTVCPTCGRHMSRCAICMLWLGTPTTLAAKVDEEHGSSNSRLARMLAFCVRCGHGYHADHAREWFEKPGGVCAVPDCLCMCGLA
ncbi:hypothetical protein B0A55_03777 [Friedmanniomyces simplex]|uniref:Uncharacterized protein n=1 Tax=Friedmanniomyces simplex TaxID=329884 RepID=A0A4U0XLP6_9PEZI|nr:hypothetical protein B0A55_03777 [Friedmanniomyces simplex]